MAAAGSGAGILSALLTTTLGGSHAGSVPMHVVVRTAGMSPLAAEESVSRLGGHITRELPLVDGFAAVIPGDEIGRLANADGVAAVTPDLPLRLFSINGYDNGADVNSLYNVTQMTGAQALWSAGYTGKGVDVALIDTGVVPVNGLTAAGKVVQGPDLSFDSQSSALSNLDGYGHGTHMAGIIAGRDDAVSSSTAYAGDTSDFIGMAPDSRVVSVRVGDHTGSADVSQVIAAIDWVVQHRTDNGLNIKVMNLSFGTDSNQPYQLDPLAFAAEQAWKAGITVVAAAGNFGSQLGHLTDPATDPYLIAVGAADTMGTTATNDDQVASFSSQGNGTRNPDVVAPGVHVASLRDPGSWLDTNYGSTATVGGRFFRGSGTSQATAVVSGGAALLLSAHPGWTPDQVKWALSQTASKLKGTQTVSQGSGEIALQYAVNSPANGQAPTQTWQNSSGTGTLQGSRGSITVTANNVALTGEQDIMGHAFNSGAMASLEASATSWNGGTWNGSGWSGSGWSGSGWSGSGWSGSGWSGTTWTGSGWFGSGWSGSTWAGSGWSGSGWSGSGWSGSGWSGSGWSGSGWSGSGWYGASWSGSGWSGSGWSGSGWSGSGWSGSTWS